jgi:hypothetical protein
MKKIGYALVLLFLFSRGLFGQEARPDFGSAEMKAVIDELCENLEREYIFPEITEEYVRVLRGNFRSGAYDGIGDPQDFARSITDDLMSVHRDRHLSVRFNPEWVQNELGKKELDEDAISLQRWRNRSSNYGFEEIKILPGNIGYFKFNGFSYDADAYEPAIGAMNFLANTAALIIDLRTNGGGSPEMVQFLCSYFLDTPRQLLNSFSYKDPEKLTQYWTYTHLPGKRLTEVDLYLLTSENTFSAAEEFAYNLKNLERAVVIGETTGGGAHDNKFVILTDNFMMSLPFARAVNPVTKTNWEEVGVEPDIEVPQDEALATALALASKRLSEQEGEPQAKSYYRWFHEAYEAALHPVILDVETMRSLTGVYGPRTITLEGGSLFYQREGRAKLKMTPISSTYFLLHGTDTFRIEFIKEDHRVIAVQGRNPSGATDKHLKN